MFKTLKTRVLSSLNKSRASRKPLDNGIPAPVFSFFLTILIHISAGVLLISSLKHLKDERNN